MGDVLSILIGLSIRFLHHHQICFERRWSGEYAGLSCWMGITEFQEHIFDSKLLKTVLGFLHYCHFYFPIFVQVEEFSCGYEVVF